MPDFNNPEIAAPVITKRVLEKVRLNVQERLGQVQLQGIASHLRAEVVEEHLTHNILVHFQTWLLGGNFHDVRLEEVVVIPVPATWWDHLKETLYQRAVMREQEWLMRRLAPRIRYIDLKKTVTKSERVATHVCPHVTVPGDHRGDLVHYSWMNGEVSEAQGLAEELKCNGRTN